MAAKGLLAITLVVAVSALRRAEEARLQQVEDYDAADSLDNPKNAWAKIADTVNYWVEKSPEIVNLDEDLLLTVVSRSAQLSSTVKARTRQFIPVAKVHALHPVGSWRAPTWQKTQHRKNAIMQAADLIVSRGKQLLLDDVNDNSTGLSPLRSEDEFIVIPFKFCGYEYVLLDGNGRLKAMQLAAAENPALAGLAVEMTVLSYTTENLQLVQERVALLWNMYVERAAALSEADAAKKSEYNSFKIGIARCDGIDQGFGLPKLSCPIVDSTNGQVGTMLPNTLFGTTAVFKNQLHETGKSWLGNTQHHWTYQMCNNEDFYVVSDAPGEVTTFCAKCLAEMFLF